MDGPADQRSPNDGVRSFLRPFLRRLVGDRVAQPAAEVPGRSAFRPARIPIRAPVVAATDDRRRASERGASTGCAKRLMPPNRSTRKSSPGARATGVQAARRCRGEVAARRRSWIRRDHSMARHPPTSPCRQWMRPAFRPPRIPIRASAVASATTRGRRDGPAASAAFSHFPKRWVALEAQRSGPTDQAIKSLERQ